MYISTGNRKLEKSSRLFLIWNIPAEASCPGSTPLCRKYCYAKKAERLYRGVRKCREENMAASRRPNFVSEIISLIEKIGPRPYFRIHESGDFYDQRYLNAWADIARQFPDTIFLAYTQSFHLEFLNIPENMVIRYSVWPDTDISLLPDGPLAFVGDSRFLMPDRYDKAVQCSKKCADCLFCWNSRLDVRFAIH